MIHFFSPAACAAPIGRLSCIVGPLGVLLALLLPGAAQAQAPAWAAAVAVMGGSTAADNSSSVLATAVDSRGNVFVTGSFRGTVAFGSTVLTSAGSFGDFDLFVAKYVPSTATWAWAQRGGGTLNDVGQSIAVSGSSVYVTGSIQNNTADDSQVRFGSASTARQNGASTTLTADLVVAKYTDNGASATLGWTQVGGGTSGDVGIGIAASGASVYVTGTITNNTADASQVRFGGGGTAPGTSPQNGASATTTADLVVAKYTDNGSSATLGWTQVGGGTGNDVGIGIAVSGASVYATGYINNNSANGNGVIFGGGGTAPGTVPVNGASATTTADLVVAKYTDNGSSATLGWTQVGGGTGNDVGIGIAASGASVYATGYTNNNSADASQVRFGGGGTTPGTLLQNGASSNNTADLVVAKYTDNGSSATLGWTQVGGGTGNDLGRSIALSGASVYVTGSITNTTTDASQVRFGGGGTAPGTVQVNGASTASSDDLVVAKYTDNGASATLGWTQVGGGTGNDLGLGIAVSGQNVLTAGYVTSSASFGSFAVAAAAGLNTAVLARLVDNTLTPLPVRAAGSPAPAGLLALAPNPSRATTLSGAEAGAPVAVFDALGRPVLTATADAAGTARLVLPTGLAPGVYVVRSGARAVRLAVE